MDFIKRLKLYIFFNTRVTKFLILSFSFHFIIYFVFFFYISTRSTLMVSNTVFCFFLFFFFSVCFTWISKTADQLVRDTLNKNFFICREMFSLIRQLYSVFCINNKCTIITDEVIIKCIKLRPWQAILFFGGKLFTT